MRGLDGAVGRLLEQLTDEDATSSRIVAAALHQFELFGVYRSTVEDIARRAGLSRVTLYRRFPGKQNLVEAVISRELASFLTALDETIDGLPTAQDRLTEGFVFTLDAMRSHALLNRLLQSEPEALLPYLTVEGGYLVGTARDYLASRLARDYADDRGGDELLVVSEVVVRLMVSFLLTPQTLVDLDDPEAARRFAVTYLGPMISGGQVRPPATRKARP